MSQSCDLANDKVEIVLVCPYYSLTYFMDSLPAEQTSNRKSKDKIKNNLKNGFLPGYHLLNKDNGFFDDFQIVDFRNVYGIQKNNLRQIVSEQLSMQVRLLPPYREHLSQAFARYFMRVGLPQDITF